MKKTLQVLNELETEGIIMLQTGRAKDRQRFLMFFDQSVDIHLEQLRDIAKRHSLSETLDEWQI